MSALLHRDGTLGPYHKYVDPDPLNPQSLVISEFLHPIPELHNDFVRQCQLFLPQGNYHLELWDQEFLEDRQYH